MRMGSCCGGRQGLPHQPRSPLPTWPAAILLPFSARTPPDPAPRRAAPPRRDRSFGSRSRTRPASRAELGSNVPILQVVVLDAQRAEVFPNLRVDLEPSRSDVRQLPDEMYATTTTIPAHRRVERGVLQPSITPETNAATSSSEAVFLPGGRCR